MTEEAKKFRSKYFFVPRRTTLPKLSVEATERKYQQLKDLERKNKPKHSGNER